jgi:hypothetical protein
MKTLLLTFLLSGSTFAAECRLIGVLNSEKEIETSFSTQTEEECRILSRKSLQNNFFGLIDENDALLKTHEEFEEEL